MMDFPFPIWHSEKYGYLPAIFSKNINGELTIFEENDMPASTVFVNNDAIKQIKELERQFYEFQEESFRLAKEQIDNIRHGETTDTIIQVPKTPRTIKKTRKRKISKLDSSVVQPIRRSTRCTRSSVRVDLNIDQSRVSLATLDKLVSDITQTKQMPKSRKKTRIVIPPTELNAEDVPTAPTNVSPKVQNLIQYHEHVIDEHKVPGKTVQSTKAKVQEPSIETDTDTAADAVKYDATLSKHNRKSRRSNARRSLAPSLSSTTKTISRKSRASEMRKSMVQVLRDSLANDQLSESNNRESDQLKSISENEAVVVIEAMLVEPDEVQITDHDSIAAEDTVETVDTVMANTSHMDTGDESADMTTSTCSSGAASIDFDTKVQLVEVEEVVLLEESDLVLTVSESEEEKELEISPKFKAPQRRSVRKSHSKIQRSFIKRHSGVRKSSRIHRASMQNADPETLSIPEEVLSGEDGSQNGWYSETEQPAKKSRPKIAKPVIKQKKLNQKKPPVSRTAGTLKRSRAIMNMNGSFNYGQRNNSPSPKQKRSSNVASSVRSYVESINRSQRSRKVPVVSSFLNRSTVASRAHRTPGRASPMAPNRLLLSPMFKTPSQHNINTTVKSFLQRNTPERVNKEMEIEVKKMQLEKKRKKEEERQQRIKEDRIRKQEESKRKREERLRKANKLREDKERAEKERQDQIQDKWQQRIADADRTKSQRKVEENAKMQKEMEKLAKAEARRKEEEVEKAKKLKELEEEKERRFQALQSEKKLAEEQRAKERKLEEERREEQRRLEEEKQREEKEQEERRKRQLEADRIRIAEEEERVRKRQEQLEIERARKKREDELAAEIAMKKKRQEELQQLKEQREKVRKEREAARKKKMEEKRLAKEEKNKLKEQEKREKEERKRQQQELLRQEKEEKELAQEQEEARKRQEEARNIREEQVRLEAVEKERILKKEESLKKREMLRKKVEEQRLLREQQQKQERARVLENQKELKQESYLRKLKEAEVRIQKLQESKLTAVPKTPGTSGYLNTTYTASGDTTLESNYNMTPRGPGRPLLPSTEENYNIDDFQSDDSTDEEDKPKKVVPRWAKGLPLQAACVKQYNTPPDIDRIFLGLLKPVELNKLFKNCNKPRYFKRTSSAHWSSPIMPHAHTSFTQQCKGFN